MQSRKTSSYPSRTGRLLTVIAVAAGVLAAGMLPMKNAAQAAGHAPKYVEGEVLVHFKDGTTDAQKVASLNRVGVVAHAHVKTDAMEREGDVNGFHRIRTAQSTQAAIQALAADPAVEYAEPNWVCTTDVTSNDPYYTGGNLWGMYGDTTTPANTYGSGAAKAWAKGYTGSSSVYVGVIDQGIQYTHPDLAANIWTNPYDGNDGKDNDGNGYVDDLHGWNFYGNNNQIYSATDGDTHGTHVAGTIGAVGGNGAGVVGVNWAVKIISGKFIGPNGGNTSDAVRAIDYMTNLKVSHGLNIVALSNSWGGGGYSQTLHDAIIRAAKQNILFIAAAGNAGSNTDITANYPSCYDTSVGTSTQTPAGYNSVVAVAAIDNLGGLAGFSNYGATTVHIGAPGVSVLSTYPTDSYATLSGTSMATPHVSGAVALYASTHPTASALDIRNALLASATPTASLAGKTTTGGRLNISGMMGILPTPLVSTVTLASSLVNGGVGTTGTVTLNMAAQSGGQAVTLTSSDPAAQVPASITIPAGGTSATFTVTTSTVSVLTAATISASANGSTATAVLSIGGSGTSGLYDSFTDTTGVQLPSHTMDQGAGWSATNAGAFCVQTGRAMAMQAIQYIQAEGGSADGTLTCTINFQNKSNDMGLYLRSDAAGSNAFLFDVNAINKTAVLYERTNGSDAARVSANVMGTVQSLTADYTLKVVLSGSTITCYLNNAQVLTYTSTNKATNTKFGFFSGGASTAVGQTWDEFRFAPSGSSTGGGSTPPPPPPATTTSISDAFTDSDGVALGSHTMTSGTGWGTSASTAFSISTNRCLTNTPIQGAWTQTNAADGTLTATLNYQGKGNDMGLFFRSDGTFKNGFLFDVNPYTGAAALYERTSGSDVARVSTNVGLIVTSMTQDYALKVVLSGSTITCYINGSQVLTYTSTSKATNTQHGIFSGGYTPYVGQTFDDFQFTPA